MALESELIYTCTQRGIPWEAAVEMELWQMAAAFGLHRIETRAEHDAREIEEVKAEYWEHTGAERMARMAKVAERRRERKGAGKR